jgi:hypothetical protein
MNSQLLNNMIQLFINGKQACLYKDFSLELILNNPVLVTDREDASYPIRLPLNANRHIFGHLDRLTQNDFIGTMNASVRFGAFNILTGYAKISEITEKEVEIYIITDTKSFYGTYGNKNFVQLSFESIYDYGTMEALVSNTYDKDNQETNIVFPPIYDHKNVIFPGEPQYNRFDPFSGRPAKDKTSGQAFMNTICPCLFLNNAIRMLFDACGY